MANRDHEEAIIKAYLSASKIDLNYTMLSPGGKKMFDAIINTNPPIAVEIKRLIDRNDVSANAQWSKATRKLKEAIAKLDGSDPGIFLITTPRVFNYPSGQAEINSAAKIILDAIKRGSKKAKVFDEEFKIKKLKGKAFEVVFSMSYGGSIDSYGTIHANISKKIKAANDQLSVNIEGTTFGKKILIIDNNYRFASKPSEIIRGIVLGSEELINYDQIDEIWVQSGDDENKLMTLVYTKKFWNGVLDGKLEKIQENAELLQLWYVALDSQGEKYKQTLYDILRTFLKDSQPHSVFPNNQVREEMVRLGIWLCDNQRFDDAAWLVEQFINDPDPINNPAQSGDKRENYQQQIIAGEDPGIITTVLGHLAWVIQKMTVDRDHIDKAFCYTLKLLKHENLYVKLEALIPLIEISARRSWLTGWDKRPLERDYKVFHDTVWEILEKYSQYPTISKWLSHVFYHYKDITDDEAVEVLEKLSNTDEAAPLFVYFGIFRKNHFENLPPFDGSKTEKLLIEVIKSEKFLNSDLRSSVLWRLWKITKDDPEFFADIEPYLDAFFRAKIDNGTQDYLFMVIETNIDKHTETCLKWMYQTLEYLVEESSKEKFNPGTSRAWIHLPKTLEWLQENRPKDHEKVRNLQKTLKNNGVYF